MFAKSCTECVFTKRVYKICVYKTSVGAILLGHKFSVLPFLARDWEIVGSNPLFKHLFLVSIFTDTDHMCLKVKLVPSLTCPCSHGDQTTQIIIILQRCPLQQVACKTRCLADWLSVDNQPCTVHSVVKSKAVQQHPCWRAYCTWLHVGLSSFIQTTNMHVHVKYNV